MNERIDAFITRHATSSSSRHDQDPRYPGLSPDGIKEAWRAALVFISPFIEVGPDRSLLFLGPVSDIPRTGSTMRRYGAALREFYSVGEENPLILTPADEIRSISSEVQRIRMEIEQNPDKKIVCAFPLRMLEFSLYQSRWASVGGLDYINELIAQYEDDDPRKYYKATRDWIEQEIEGMIPPDKPSPSDVAKERLRGLKRAHFKAKAFVGDRPVMIGAVDHSMALDVLNTYIIGNGVMSQEAFNEATDMGSDPPDLIQPTEQIILSMMGNEVQLVWRRKSYNTNLSAL